MRRFMKLTENNDHEGEIWHHWLQVDGNSVELTKLDQFLEQKDPDGDCFELRFEPLRYEDEVDLLVEEADCGYMSTHTKVVGKANFGDLSLVDEPSDILYKGGIEDFFS